MVSSKQCTTDFRNWTFSFLVSVRCRGKVPLCHFQRYQREQEVMYSAKIRVTSWDFGGHFRRFLRWLAAPVLSLESDTDPITCNYELYWILCWHKARKTWSGFHRMVVAENRKNYISSSGGEISLGVVADYCLCVVFIRVDGPNGTCNSRTIHHNKCITVTSQQAPWYLKSPRHWPFWAESTGYRWIFLTKDQWPFDDVIMMNTIRALSSFVMDMLRVSYQKGPIYHV